MCLSQKIQNIVFCPPSQQERVKDDNSCYVYNKCKQKCVCWV